MTRPTSTSKRRTEPAANRQRDIQRKQDRDDALSGRAQGKQEAKAVQAGARDQPSKLPKQHVAKPGREADLKLQPRFLAPDYRGSGKLEGMTALITGADSGIGRAVAVLFAREGADVSIVYLSSHDDAEETRRCVEAEGKRCLLISGDVKDAAFCVDAVQHTVDEFRRLDILVNNAAFQEHAESLEDLTDERLDETFRTNVFGYFHMAKAALPHLKKGCAAPGFRSTSI